VRDLDRRLLEAASLGFKRAIVPAALRRGRGRPPEGLELMRAVTVREAIAAALGEEG
jgi:DNA repair protein RadA/Sms